MNVKIERNKEFQYTVTFINLELNQFTALRWVLGQIFNLDKETNKEIEKLRSELETSTKDFFNNGLENHK